MAIIGFVLWYVGDRRVISTADRCPTRRYDLSGIPEDADGGGKP